MQRPEPDEEALRTAFTFLLKLLLLAIPFHWAVSHADLTPLQNVTASTVHTVMSGIGVEVTLDGALLRFQGFDVLVSRDSTGWKSLFFLTALIIATPAPNRQKLIGIFTLLPVVFTVNIIRITVTSYSVFYGVEVFNLLHDILWQAGMMATVLLAWLLWMRERGRMEKAAGRILSRPSGQS